MLEVYMCFYCFIRDFENICLDATTVVSSYLNLVIREVLKPSLEVILAAGKSIQQKSTIFILEDSLLNQGDHG